MTDPIVLPAVVLRNATVEDVPLLRHWDEQPHIVESDPNDDWQWETELRRDPDWREQLVAQVHEGERLKPIGFIQIIDPALEDSHYWGDVEPNLRAIDIWIGEAPYLNRGFGTQMMRQAIERCFSDPSVTAILIDPLFINTRARRFYERFGFQFVREQSFGDDHCAVYQLDRRRYEEDSNP